MVFPSKIGFCQEYTNHGVITLSATSREQLLIQPNPFTAPQPPYYISVVTAVNKTPPLIKPPPPLSPPSTTIALHYHTCIYNLILINCNHPLHHPPPHLLTPPFTPFTSTIPPITFLHPYQSCRFFGFFHGLLGFFMVFWVFSVYLVYSVFQ